MGVEGWQRRRIAELFNMQLGKMLSPAASAGPNQAPYITNRHVQWDRVLVDDLDTMSFTSAERDKFSLERNDLLVCEGGDVGRSALWLDNAREVFFQKAIHRLRPRVPDVLPSFALRLMRRAASSGAFTDYTSQTSIAHLTQEKLGQVEFTLPPLPEQRAIAAVLDTIDDAIRKTEQIIAKLQQVKQGLLHDLLTRGIDDNGELRDPERHPEQFQDSPLGRIPKGWEVVAISSAGEVRLGKQKSLDKAPGPWTRPYLRVVNVFDDQLDLRDVNAMDFSPSEMNRYGLKDGDVLLTEGDLGSAFNVGRSAVFRGELPGCCFQNSLLRFRVSGAAVADFFHFAFCRLRLLGVFARATMSTTVFHLSAGRLAPLPIMKPPFAEQQEIAARLRALDVAVALERANNKKLRTLKAGLAEDLLTGRVRTTSLAEVAA